MHTPLVSLQPRIRLLPQSATATSIAASMNKNAEVSELDPNIQKRKRFRIKGVCVKEKVYMRHIFNKRHGANIRKIFSEKRVAVADLTKNESCTFVELEGRRIIHPKTLGQQLFCYKCNSVLSLVDVVEERKCGLASILYTKCRQCNAITRAHSDKQHPAQNNSGQKSHFDTNTLAVIGTLNAGMGETHLNKVLSAMNIPVMNWKTYKTHESEIGLVVEKMAHDSCLAATKLEKQLTLENIEELKKLLPLHLQNGFIIPNIPHGGQAVVPPNPIMSPSLPVDLPAQALINSLEQLVRVAGCFDMGWFTRGTGRSYDSPSGQASLIGKFSKKVMSYVVLNRKCKKCDAGHPQSDHDCRLNFRGSAKAMEPAAAVKLMVNNPILVEANVEIGIMIADNDSCSISAVKNASDHEIVKQNDKNHTSKGVTNELFKLVKKHKSFNSTSVAYIQKCFNYAVSQNIGNAISMAKSIKNIPFHCSNVHTGCGDWCGYLKDPANYRHSVIGEGFTDQKLIDDLKCLFNTLASNVNRFVVGESSNGCESYNAMVVSKAPKSRVYGMTASGDFRTSCAVNKKNDGEKYILNLKAKLLLSPGRHTKKFCQKSDLHSKTRYEKSLTRDFKRRRIYLKQRKTALRNARENAEGTSYETDMGLLQNTENLMPISNFQSMSRSVIFFDTETTNLCRKADIIHLAAKCGEKTFSMRIMPKQKISPEASAVNGLTVVNGNLCYRGQIVESQNLENAMIEFYKYLQSFGKKCILVAHNCRFDYPKLLNAMEKVSMMKQFESVIGAFCDTLPMIKKMLNAKGKGENKLETLASKLQIDTVGAHDALCDVIMLERVVEKLDISHDKIVQCSISWLDTLEKNTFINGLPKALKKLEPLEKSLSLEMRKKIVKANISYEMILNAYTENKFAGVANIFGRDENGVVRVTKARGVIQKLCDHLMISSGQIAQANS